MAKETFEFQAEAKQVLDLVIHSLYSNPDIFLRELISNASDAIDRLRFEAVAKPELIEGDPDYRIFIERDSEARTLTVWDNGIGMSRSEAVENLGAIAKSGTQAFIRAMQEVRDQEAPPELIGQFGVGFYSAFIVADKVTVVTRRAGEDAATRWESEGDGAYTLEAASRAQRGTSVTLHLKPADDETGFKDYTQEYVIRQIVRKYSDFVAFPIQMKVTRTEVEKDEEGRPKPGGETKTHEEIATLNSMKAIWLRERSEVPDEEYHEFYKHISHDWNPPLDTIQAKIEGLLEYRLLLFIPTSRPLALFRADEEHGVHLYVKRVFIMDDCKELLPSYLRFVRGVVDSEDLTLNVSREILQQDRQVQKMRKGIVAKVLDALDDMAEKRPDDYAVFWREFGAVLKEGLYMDPDQQGRLLGLLRAASTASDEEVTSLSEYVQRMAAGQEVIYYMTGRSREALEDSPHLEAFRKKGYEVLLLTEPVDDIWVQSVTEYEGYKLRSAGKGDVELGSEEERKEAGERRKASKAELAGLFEALQKELDDYVKEVRPSNRLTDSAACLVGDEGDLTPELEQLLRAANQPVPESKRILELNPDHPLVAKLRSVYEGDASDPRVGRYARLLHGQALLAEGRTPPSPAEFSRLLSEVMENAL